MRSCIPASQGSFSYSNFERKLKEILGSEPLIHVENNLPFSETFVVDGQLVTRTGLFLKIIAQNGKSYTVSPSQFSQSTGVPLRAEYKKIKGDGLFAGPWDGTGYKIATCLFSEHGPEALIYINNKKCHVKKDIDGFIDFIR